MGYADSLKISFPFLHVLMNKKTEEAYKKVFLEFDSILKETYNSKDLCFEPTIITTDFELALLNASKWAYPKSKSLGCFVHFLRAQINRLKTLGFAKYVHKKSKYQLLTLVSSLPFMLPKAVKNAFGLIRNMFPEFEAYFDYFQSTWIDGSFPIETWNILSKLSYHQSLSENLKHSNNQIESFHSLLNYALLKSSEPELSEFVDGLIYIEAKILTDLNEIEGGSLIKVNMYLLTKFIEN